MSDTQGNANRNDDEEDPFKHQAWLRRNENIPARKGMNPKQTLNYLFLKSAIIGNKSITYHVTATVQGLTYVRTAKRFIKPLVLLSNLKFNKVTVHAKLPSNYTRSLISLGALYHGDKIEFDGSLQAPTKKFPRYRVGYVRHATLLNHHNKKREPVPAHNKSALRGYVCLRLGLKDDSLNTAIQHYKHWKKYRKLKKEDELWKQDPHAIMPALAQTASNQKRIKRGKEFFYHLFRRYYIYSTKGSYHDVGNCSLIEVQWLTIYDIWAYLTSKSSEENIDYINRMICPIFQFKTLINVSTSDKKVWLILLANIKKLYSQYHVRMKPNQSCLDPKLIDQSLENSKGTYFNHQTDIKANVTPKQAVDFFAPKGCSVKSLMRDYLKGIRTPQDKIRRTVKEFIVYPNVIYNHDRKVFSKHYDKTASFVKDVASNKYMFRDMIKDCKGQEFIGVISLSLAYEYLNQGTQKQRLIKDLIAIQFLRVWHMNDLAFYLDIIDEKKTDSAHLKDLYLGLELAVVKLRQQAWAFDNRRNDIENDWADYHYEQGGRILTERDYLMVKQFVQHPKIFYSVYDTTYYQSTLKQMSYLPQQIYDCFKFSGLEEQIRNVSKGKEMIGLHLIALAYYSYTTGHRSDELADKIANLERVGVLSHDTVAFLCLKLAHHWFIPTKSEKKFCKKLFLILELAVVRFWENS